MNLIKDAQQMFDNLTDGQKKDCLIQEIQNIYILLKDNSRDSKEESVTSSVVNKEDAAIRNMEVFMLIEYIRTAIEMILETD